MSFKTLLKQLAERSEDEETGSGEVNTFKEEAEVFLEEVKKSGLFVDRFIPKYEGIFYYWDFEDGEVSKAKFRKVENGIIHILILGSIGKTQKDVIGWYEREGYKYDLLKNYREGLDKKE